jgi:Delta3-Delta2-enoyl-CoA isomerase
MLETHDDGPIRTLRLARPPVNALHEESLRGLEAAIAAAPRAGARGLVLTGTGERFSAGLDVPQLLRLDRAGIESFWRAFFGCLTSIAASPIPIVAAINGHSPAGGAVLALFCDRRVMARGDYRIGLNEVQVGLYPGPVIHRVLERVVGSRHAAELLSTGTLLAPEAALALGFVDELASPGELASRSKAWLDRVLALPPAAYAATRALVRRDLVDLMQGRGAQDYAAMSEAWLSMETQTVLRRLFVKASPG